MYVEMPFAGGEVEIDENGVERTLEFKEYSMEPIKFESFNVKIAE